MKVKDISGKAASGARMNLSSILPLRTPLVERLIKIYALMFFFACFDHVLLQVRENVYGKNECHRGVRIS